MTHPIDTSPEAIAALLVALRSGEQADMDGCVVRVSRQACEEAADLITRLTAERNEARAQVARWQADANLMLGFAQLAYEAGAKPSSSELIAARDRCFAARDAAMRNEGRRQAATICNMSYGDGLGAAHARILATLEPEGGE